MENTGWTTRQRWWFTWRVFYVQKNQNLNSYTPSTIFCGIIIKKNTRQYGGFENTIVTEKYNIIKILVKVNPSRATKPQ